MGSKPFRRKANKFSGGSSKTWLSAQKKLPILDMVAAVEEGARKLKTEEANDLRGRVCGVLRNAKQPRTILQRSTGRH